MQNENAQVASGRPSIADRFGLAEVFDQGLRLAHFRLKRLQRNVRRRALPLRDFASELLRAPRDVGAVCPSSRTLARAMAEGVDVDNDRLLIELGAGTGSVTQALLDRGVAAGRLIVIERSAVLADRLRRRFPAINVIQGDAAQLTVLLGEPACKISGIVSSLPLRSLQPAVADAIIAGILEVLGDGGRLVQFTYDLRRTSVPERPGLDQLYTRRVWANLPPARVDVFDYQAGGEALVTTNTAC